MQLINVQFSDSTKASIVSYFSTPQDPAVYPNQGSIFSNDARWSAYYAAQPAAVQKGIPAPNS